MEYGDEGSTDGLGTVFLFKVVSETQFLRKNFCGFMKLLIIGHLILLW